MSHKMLQVILGTRSIWELCLNYSSLYYRMRRGNGIVRNVQLVFIVITHWSRWSTTHNMSAPPVTTVLMELSVQHNIPVLLEHTMMDLASLVRMNVSIALVCGNIKEDIFTDFFKLQSHAIEGWICEPFSAWLTFSLLNILSINEPPVLSPCQNLCIFMAHNGLY